MEELKFICEFFFTDFWHWLGGICYIAVISGGSVITISKSKKDGNN